MDGEEWKKWRGEFSLSLYIKEERKRTGAFGRPNLPLPTPHLAHFLLVEFFANHPPKHAFSLYILLNGESHYTERRGEGLVLES